MAVKISIQVEGYEDPFFLKVDVDRFDDPIIAFKKMGLFDKPLTMKVRIEKQEIKVSTQPRG